LLLKAAASVRSSAARSSSLQMAASAGVTGPVQEKLGSAALAARIDGKSNGAASAAAIRYPPNLA
jgi:hypothetical protein